MKNIIEFIKFWWWRAIVIIVICYLFFNWAFGLLGYPDLSQFRNKPIHSMTIGDLAIIVLIHAFINKSEFKK